MERILPFFSDLILFTFGLLVLIFWLVIIVLVVIEIHDLIVSRGKEEE